MKKLCIGLMMMVALTLPLGVYAATAADTKASISCQSAILYSGQQTTCTLSASVPDGVSINGVTTSIAIPEGLTLVGKMTAASGWEGSFDEGSTDIDIYTADNASGKISLVNFVVKADNVTSDDSVSIIANDLELSDSNFELSTASGITATITLKAGKAPGANSGANNNNNTTNTPSNSTNNTTDRENPETGSSFTTIVVGVAMLSIGAFVVSQVTRKSKFSKIK